MSQSTNGNGSRSDVALDDDGEDSDIAKAAETQSELGEAGDKEATADSDAVKESGAPKNDPREKSDFTTDESAQESAKKGRNVSISLRALVVSILVVVLAVTVGAMTWLYVDTNSKLNDLRREAADTAHAEQIALDYAVRAAVMDFKDLAPWKKNLVKGTTPELTDKLNRAAQSMEQILLPLQWSSTADPLVAKVRSNTNGVYVVDAFVRVMTTTVQAADPLQSTATYSVTVDSNNHWLITDVGGITGPVAPK